MMFFIYLSLGFWLTMSVYWVIKAKTNSQTSFVSEISSISKLIFSALIIYLPLLTGGWLARPLFQINIGINIIGVILCGIGVGFAIWARHVLGKNWSGKVMIQKEHALIIEGPYSVTRNPQYTGGILAFFGTALILGQVFGFIWSIFLMLGLIWKAKQEEKVLENKFPNEYKEYRRKVKMIIPYIY